MKLCQLKEGDKGIIISIDKNCIYYNRLIKMGVCGNEKIIVLRISALGSPMLINVCGYNLCIGKNIAKFITVNKIMV